MALTILQALKPKPFSLKYEIHRRLAGIEPARPHFPLRASTLLRKEVEFCPREHAFLDMGVAQQKGSFVGTSQRMTFNHGRFMEEIIRGNYLRNLAVGEWTCGVCSTPYPKFGKEPMVGCPHCHFKRWKYVEPRFSYDEVGVSGGIDILLDIGQPKLLITEIKTMAPDEFKTLAAPLAEHKLRTSLYLQLAEKSTWEPAKRVNTSEAQILYVVKSFGFKDETLKAQGIKDAPFSPFKEFTIKRDDSLVKTALAKAKVLKIWREDKKGMPCGVCANGLSKRAQSCTAVGPCFSGSYPSTLTWRNSDGVPAHQGKTLIT